MRRSCIDRKTISVYVAALVQRCEPGVSDEALSVRNAERIAGVELGGTKAVAVLWEDGCVVDEVRRSDARARIDVRGSARAA